MKISNIYEILKSNQDKLRNLTQEMLKAETTEKQGDVLCKIKKELTLHLDVGEIVLYNTIKKNDDLSCKISSLKEEHEEIKTLLAELSKTSVNKSCWSELAMDLNEVISSYIQKEEEIFDEAKKIIPQDKAINLGREFEDLKSKKLKLILRKVLDFFCIF